MKIISKLNIDAMSEFLKLAYFNPSLIKKTSLPIKQFQLTFLSRQNLNFYSPLIRHGYQVICLSINSRL